MNKIPRTCLLTLYPPDARFKVIYKNVHCLPPDHVACVTLQPCTTAPVLPFEHHVSEPRSLHWRLHDTAANLVYKHHWQSRRIASDLARRLASFKPQLLWVLPELGAASVGWHLQRALQVPLHLTLHDAHETARFIVPPTYYPIYATCVRRIIKAADSIDGISQGMLDYVAERYIRLTHDQTTVIPPSIDAQHILDAPDPSALDTSSQERRIGLCGSMRISLAQWRAFLDKLAELPFAFTLMAFVYEDLFFDTTLPDNVKVQTMPFAETERDVIDTFRKAGIHACHLGLYADADRALFGQTSLSAKLTTYAASSLPILLDGPRDSAAGDLIDQYRAGVCLGEADDPVAALRALFSRPDIWHGAAVGAGALARHAFDLHANVDRFQEVAMPDRQPLIWFLTQGYRVAGGHEAHVLHFATAMRDRGFRSEVWVVDRLPTEPHRVMRQLGEAGIPLSSIGDMLNRTVGALGALLYLPWALRARCRQQSAAWGILHRYLLERLGARCLAKAIAQHAPDVIHVHGRLPETFWAALPAERCLFYHGTEGHRDATWDASEASAFAAFCDRCAINVAPGNGVAHNVKQAFGITAEFASVYTLCPDQDGAKSVSAVRSDRQGAQTHFGVLCRLTPEKGIDDLLDALRRVHTQFGDVHFTFIGTGALAEHIRAWIELHRLHTVRLVENFTSAVDALSELDVFVHPSRSDAMPLAVAEALMCGLPCIVSDVGGLPELVRDGVEGYVIPKGDCDALAAAMMQMANMSLAKRNAFSERARLRYESVCRTNVVAARLAALYQELMDV